MVNIRGTRRLRLAIELICEKLEITDKDINAYIVSKKKATNAPKKEESKPLTVVETVKLIEAVTALEGLEKFASDERKCVISAVEAKKAELEGGE